jgi:hypothetical protein
LRVAQAEDAAAVGAAVAGLFIPVAPVCGAQRRSLVSGVPCRPPFFPIRPLILGTRRNSCQGKSRRDCNPARPPAETPYARLHAPEGRGTGRGNQTEATAGRPRKADPADSEEGQRLPQAKRRDQGKDGK